MRVGSMSHPAVRTHPTYSHTHTTRIYKGLYKHTMAHLGFDEEKKKRWKGEAAKEASAKAD